MSLRLLCWLADSIWVPALASQTNVACKCVLAFLDRPDVLAQDIRLVPRCEPDPPFGDAILGGTRHHAGAQRMAREVARLKAGGGATSFDDAGDASIREPRGTDKAGLVDGPEER